MKKAKIFLGVVFCIFLLCSVSYQPVLADDAIGKIVELNDCDCNKKRSTNAWPFPIICTLLTILFKIITRIGSIYIRITGEQSEIINNFLTIIINGLETFNCEFNNRFNIYSFLN